MCEKMAPICRENYVSIYNIGLMEQKLFLFNCTRRFGWPTATLLLAPAEGWGTLRVPRLLNFEIILFILIDLQHVKNNFIEVLRS